MDVASEITDAMVGRLAEILVAEDWLEPNWADPWSECECCGRETGGPYESKLDPRGSGEATVRDDLRRFLAFALNGSSE